MDVPLERLRNIGIMAHIDAGKTTTTERVLYYSGKEHRMGEVDNGTATMDYLEEEKRRGITITSAATSFQWRDCLINLIDTPGHVDFTAEVERSLRVLDGAIIVFDAQAGVEAQSETVWRQADRYRVPRLCFVNKMDKAGADFYYSLQTMRERLEARVLPLQMPVGRGEDFRAIIDLIEMKLLTWDESTLGAKYHASEVPGDLLGEAQMRRHEMLDILSNYSEPILAQLLDSIEPSAPEIRSAIRQAALRLEVFPVFCGSALRFKGIQKLLDGVCDYLPSPVEVPPVKGIHPKTEKEIVRAPSPSEPFTALAFKVLADRHGELVFLRIYSGTLKPGQQVLNATRDRRERVQALYQMHAAERIALKEASAGSIVACVGPKWTTTGDTLTDPRHPIVLEKMAFPETVISMAVVVPNSEERDKLIDILSLLEKEDPTFEKRVDDETGEITVSGMGELHLEVIRERLLREYNIAPRLGRPSVNYRESIRSPAEAEWEHNVQIAGRGHYACVRLRLEPIDPAKGLVIENRARDEEIPRAFLPAVEEGIRTGAAAGPLSAYKVIGVKATILGGRSHPTDSSDAAFTMAACRCFSRAMEMGHPVLLEPWMALEVIIPEQYVGDVLTDLSMRRGTIHEVKTAGKLKVIRARVPLSETFGYSTTVRSLSQGRASYSMEPHSYAEVPARIAETLRI